MSYTKKKLDRNALEKIIAKRSQQSILAIKWIADDPSFVPTVDIMKIFTRLLKFSLKKNKGNIRIKDVYLFEHNIALSHLKIPNTSLKSIYGIDKLQFLIKLDINDNQINNISPIVKCEHLRTLKCARNPIYDLSCLDDLEKLVKLDISGITIQNFRRKNPFSFLLNMESLKKLYCSDNSMATFEVLRNLTNLTHLIISKNPCPCIQVVSNFRNLIMLDCSECGITDFSPLRTLKHLRQCVLSNNKITDWNVFHPDASITTLVASECDITSLEQLVEIPALCSVMCLVCDNNQLKNLVGVTKFPLLKFLSVENNQIQFLTDLIGCNNLESIDFSKNNVVSIHPLAFLPMLTKFIPSDNPLTDKNHASCVHNIIYHSRVETYLANVKAPRRTPKDDEIWRVKHVSELMSYPADLILNVTSRKIIDRWGENSNKIHSYYLLSINELYARQIFLARLMKSGGSKRYIRLINRVVDETIDDIAMMFDVLTKIYVPTSLSLTDSWNGAITIALPPTVDINEMTDSI